MRLAGYLHPAARKPLAEEAQRLWRALEITTPAPRIVERRARAPYERERIRRRSWRDLWIYQKEVPSTFHTIQDYRAALRFFIVGYPKLKDILNDWSKN